MNLAPDPDSDDPWQYQPQRRGADTRDVSLSPESISACALFDPPAAETAAALRKIETATNRPATLRALNATGAAAEIVWLSTRPGFLALSGSREFAIACLRAAGRRLETLSEDEQRARDSLEDYSFDDLTEIAGKIGRPWVWIARAQLALLEGTAGAAGLAARRASAIARLTQGRGAGDRLCLSILRSLPAAAWQPTSLDPAECGLDWARGGLL